MVKLERWERFKDARIVHNIHGTQTMDEVTTATGLTKNMISNLESEKVDRDVGYKSIAILANHYGVSADYLLGLSEDPSRKSSPIDELGLSPQSVEMIKNIGSADNGKDLLTGLNMILEGANIPIIVGRIKRLADAVQAEIDYVEGLLSENSDVKRTSTFVGLKAMELAQKLENDLSEKYPNLAGRIIVDCGQTALEKKMQEIIEAFEFNIKESTGYIDYDLLKITGKRMQ